MNYLAKQDEAAVKAAIADCEVAPANNSKHEFKFEQSEGLRQNVVICEGTIE